MNSQVPYGNRYAHWYTCNQRDLDGRLREEALDQAIGAVEAGEIITLDGVRSPLSKKIAEHHGLDQFEMNFNWVCTAQSWSCPCCSRTKFQVSRPGTKGQILAKLVIHHDHMGEALMAEFLQAFRDEGTNEAQVEGNRLVNRIGSAFAAYEEVLVCEDCNNADAKAKRAIGTPTYFSFSVSQIRGFIQSGDHRPHEIDVGKARQAWESAKAAYDLRMRIIGDVARAAATNNHWFEPHPSTSCAVPVFGDRVGYPGDFILSEWLSPGPLSDALGRNTSVSKPNLSRWRTEAPSKPRALPGNFLAILCSEEHKAKSWSVLPDDWCCPICERSKRETVEVRSGGKLGFDHKGGPRKGAWASAPRFCNHCFTVFSALKREVTQLLEVDMHDTHGVVSPGDIRAIIVARPNSPHVIQVDRARELVERVVGKPMQSVVAR